MKQGTHKPRFIGADIASRHVDVADYGQAKVLRVSNEPQALTRWLKTLPAGTVLAMESTGRYHLMLARLAHERGLQVYVINPRDVRYYAKGVGQRGKTDRLDAQLLARYVAHEHAQLHAWQPAAPELQRLDDLLRQRATLVRHREALRQSLSQDKAVADMLKSLLAPFKGLDPRAMDSGNKRGVRRLSKRGNSELRRLLFNAAMSASRTATWQPVYQRELAKGLPSTAALIVLARKLVRVAFSLFKSGSFFDPSRAQPHPLT